MIRIRREGLPPETASSIERALNQPVSLQSYAVADVPAATVPGRLIFVPDEAGGAVPAFSDGTNWRRMTDRAIIS